MSNNIPVLMLRGEDGKFFSVDGITGLGSGSGGGTISADAIKKALGYTPADASKYLPLTGGTLTGNLSGKYICGTWLQATDTGHLTTKPDKIAVFDSKGWVYYRTPDELARDIGASGKTPVKGVDYWTDADKQEIVNDVIAALPDGTKETY